MINLLTDPSMNVRYTIASQGDFGHGFIKVLITNAIPIGTPKTAKFKFAICEA